MKPWNKKERPCKAEVRTNVLNSYKGAKVAFLLPSRSCFDIEEGLHQGTFTKNTFFLLVEKKWAYISEIEEKLKALGITRYYLWTGNLTEIPLASFCKEKDIKIDFAFVDTCGNLTAPIVEWLRRNEEAFDQKGKKWFTFSTFRESQRNIWPTIAKHYECEEGDSACDNAKFLGSEAKISTMIDTTDTLRYLAVVVYLLQSVFGYADDTIFVYCDDATWMFCIEINGKSEIGHTTAELGKVRKALNLYNYLLGKWDNLSQSCLSALCAWNTIHNRTYCQFPEGDGGVWPLIDKRTGKKVLIPMRWVRA